MDTLKVTGINSKEEAIAKGWTDVRRDVHGMSWNDLGLCPLCRSEQER